MGNTSGHYPFGHLVAALRQGLAESDLLEGRSDNLLLAADEVIE